jgi:hypothetical protein
MLRNAFFASAIALGTLGGTAGAATAQDLGPRLIGGGDNAEVVYAVPSRNVVGGGLATLAGGGEDRVIAYQGAPRHEPTGLVAELIGGGDDLRLVYRAAPAPAAAPTRLAGQPARRGG